MLTLRAVRVLWMCETLRMQIHHTPGCRDDDEGCAHKNELILSLRAARVLWMCEILRKKMHSTQICREDGVGYAKNGNRDLPWAI